MEPPPDSGPHAPPGSVVQVCFPSVRTAVLDSLNQQRLEGRLCDLSIQVQRQVFRAHRCVLAASSPYFHDQVLLKNVTTVSLPSVMDPVAFESVLSSAYTGQLSILRDDIVNYVTVASFLQMWHIVDKCTEILKRPRASAEPSQGDPAPATSYPPASSSSYPPASSSSYPPASSSSRQQSPSSTDCLYVEREGSRKERRTDALPPLATWRRPQQVPRYGRPRPAAHPADSQLLGPGGESDYSSCEEVWLSSSKAFSQDGRGGRQEGGQTPSRAQGELQGEGLRLRVRPRQRDPPPGSDRQSGRERGRGEDGGAAFEGQSQEKKRNERWMEADEGVGEVEVEKSVWSQRTEHPGDFNMTAAQGIEGQMGAKVNPDVSLKKEEHEHPQGGPAPEGPLGPLSPGPTPSHRVAWQAGSWSQQGAKPQDRPEAEEDEEEEEEVDFGRFADGAFGGETYDEIEDGTGQVSQRPLLPASPDNSEFNLGEPEMDWPSSNMVQAGTSTHHLSSSSAMFPPSLSPPAPHAGAPYRGKVHFCHCGKAYTLKSMRDRHVKMQHLNLRPFGCLVCAKTFKMKHHLTKHLKTHGGLRPYECRLCGKKVIWRDSFLRHQARCERLTASYSDITSCNDPAPSSEMDYSFEGGQGFLAEGGQVKVEEADFQGEVEAGVSGLLGGEAAGVDTLEQDSG